MQVGDILEIAPSIFSFEGVSDPDDGRQRRRKKLPCTVIWVHPAKRFFVVEFRSAITGETWRDAFWPELTPQPKDLLGTPHFRTAGTAV